MGNDLSTAYPRPRGNQLQRLAAGVILIDWLRRLLQFPGPQMISGQKICWVADHLHGTIGLSRLEKFLVSTPEYNRLHNVLQNSTVYLTYPSNRTSRFIHSLGCAHIVGQMFRSAVINAETDCRAAFWKEFAKQIKLCHDASSFKADLAHQKITVPSTKLQEPHLTASFRDPFYLAEMPCELTKNGEKCAFVLLLQAIRLVGLLHDVGHPPFSHVSEHALGDLYEDLEDREKKLNKREKAVLEKFRTLRRTEETQVKATNPAFHEILGINLSAHLLQDTLDAAFENCDDVTRVTALYLKHLTLNILKEENPFYKGLHTLVAGDIDADRIDYVLRDSIMSGYQIGSLQIDRLLKSYQLVWLPEEVHQNGQQEKKINREISGHFEFLPSVRAIGILEDIFKRRANLYRQVVYHHRVVKLDALLGDCIVQLAKENLREKPEKNSGLKHADFLLPQNISGLWHVLDSEVDVFAADRTNCYIQWDDPWLLSTLRRRFMQLQAATADPSQDKFFAKLQELLSNKKRYYSLFKRADGFRQVERAFVDSFPTDFDWKCFMQQLPETATPDAEWLQRMVNSAQAANGNPQAQAATTNSTDYFALVLLFRILTLAGNWGNHGLEIAKQALEKLRIQEGFLDALLIRKPPKVGLKSSQLLVASTGFVPLGSVSTLVKELEDAAQFFPSFFVFFHPGKNKIDDRKLEQLRLDYGKTLAKEFCESVAARNTTQQLTFHSAAFWKSPTTPFRNETH